MRKVLLIISVFMFLTSCASVNTTSPSSYRYSDNSRFYVDYTTRVPATFATNGKKTIVINPKRYAWGAYDGSGQLVKAGIATSGGRVCPPDAHGESNCRTSVGSFRITSIRGEECASKTYPRPNGGGLMPYCMYFHGGQALHGSPDSIVVEDNISHGCVRMRIQDAEWMTKHFAQVGTKVVVLPYD